MDFYMILFSLGMLVPRSGLGSRGDAGPTCSASWDWGPGLGMAIRGRTY